MDQARVERDFREVTELLKDVRHIVDPNRRWVQYGRYRYYVAPAVTFNMYTLNDGRMTQTGLASFIDLVNTDLKLIHDTDRETPFQHLDYYARAHLPQKPARRITLPTSHVDLQVEAPAYVSEIVIPFDLPSNEEELVAAARDEIRLVSDGAPPSATVTASLPPAIPAPPPDHHATQTASAHQTTGRPQVVELKSYGQVRGSASSYAEPRALGLPPWEGIVRPTDPEATKQAVREFIQAGFRVRRCTATHIKIADHINYYPTTGRMHVKNSRSKKVALADLITQLRQANSARRTDG